MAAPIDLLTLLDNLPNSENPLEALTELKTHIGGVPPHELKNIVQNVSFNIIFDHLNTSNREQISLCCELLDRLLSAMNPFFILQQFYQELREGLKHPNLPVQNLVLSQILRAVKEDLHTDIGSELLISLVEKTGDDNLEVASQASKCIFHIGNRRETRSVLYDGDVFPVLERVMNKSVVIKFRIYELVINLACESAENLHLASNSGILQRAVNELYTDDILAQLNCLELLANLALTTHGLKYLEQHEILKNLENMLNSVKSDPLMSFLLPGLVKFFSSIAKFNPKETCARYPAFLSSVFEMMEDTDITNQSIAVETLGFLGKSLEGKQTLDMHSNYMERSCRILGSLLRNSQQTLKVKTLEALSNLLLLEVTQHTFESLSLTESWFKQLGVKIMQELMDLSKQPFTDVKLGILQLYQSLAHQPWGQTSMNNHPGFNEYLLDRSTEKFKEGKEAKFEVIRTIVDSPTSLEVFGRPFFMKLKQYVQEGPFFVRAQAEVAMEGSS